jgi:hypothetical protein
MNLEEQPIPVSSSSFPALFSLKEISALCCHLKKFLFLLFFLPFFPFSFFPVFKDENHLQEMHSL